MLLMTDILTLRGREGGEVTGVGKISVPTFYQVYYYPYPLCQLECKNLLMRLSCS